MQWDVRCNPDFKNLEKHYELCFRDENKWSVILSIHLGCYDTAEALFRFCSITKPERWCCRIKKSVHTLFSFCIDAHSKYIEADGSLESSNKTFSMKTIWPGPIHMPKFKYSAKAFLWELRTVFIDHHMKSAEHLSEFFNISFSHTRPTSISLLHMSSFSYALYHYVPREQKRAQKDWYEASGLQTIQKLEGDFLTSKPSRLETMSIKTIADLTTSAARKQVRGL